MSLAAVEGLVERRLNGRKGMVLGETLVEFLVVIV